ncbi:MAG: MBL fold metallo-hydrolase [Actinomycetota bacterium]|nr:MBL fold metallo-hydrolase [Actinomycetota bacterium]
MKLTILGASAAYPGVGQACSGYLLEDGETRLLIDIGTGSLSNLLRWIDPSDLDALIITHLHPDHFLDIYPLRYHYQFDASRPDFRLKTFAPTGAFELIGSILPEGAGAEMSRIFDFNDIVDGMSLGISTLKLKFDRTRHSIETFAVTVSGDKRFVYTADTGYFEGMVRIAAGADLLLSEATLQQAHLGMTEDHLAAEEAAHLAKEAGAKRLILTHIWPTYDKAVSLAEAKGIGFKGVESAEEGQIFQF